MRLRQLGSREKVVLAVGMLLLGGLLINQVVVRSIRERLSTLNRVVESKEKSLVQLKQMGTEFHALQADVAQLHHLLEAQPDKGRVLSLLEHLQEQCGLTGHIVHMQPTTTSVGDAYEETNIEVKLDLITLPQLIDFITKVESQDLAVGIKALEIRLQNELQPRLEAMVQVATVSSVTHL
jgi:general secretion pathway protein M